MVSVQDHGKIKYTVIDVTLHHIKKVKIAIVEYKNCLEIWDGKQGNTIFVI